MEIFDFLSEHFWALMLWAVIGTGVVFVLLERRRP